MSDYKIFCGVDPSLTSTGVCISSLKEDTFSTYVIKSKFFGERRLIDLRDKLERIVLEKKVDYIFYEGYSFGSRGRVFDLGELGGVFKVKLYEINIPTFIVPPTVLKKFIIGKGVGAKDLMREHVYKRYGVGSDLLKTVDEVDAFALCKFGKFLYNFLCNNACCNNAVVLPVTNTQAITKFIKDGLISKESF
jgi:Holliday junction resolvasome RuvABC endonuclease subunit